MLQRALKQTGQKGRLTKWLAFKTDVIATTYIYSSSS